MALRKHQSQTYITKPAIPAQPPIRKQAKQNKTLTTKGEKVLFLGLLTVVTILAIMITHTQTTIRATTTDIVVLEQKIDNTTKENTDLSIQVSELSAYDRIWKKAEELGLKLNEQNVKVVPGQ